MQADGAKRSRRHASLADQLAALLAYRNRPEPEATPIKSNWTTVPANDNADPEEIADMRIERRLEIVPSMKTIVEEMTKDVERDRDGKIIAIGKLRFSDGSQTERAHMYGPDGKLIRYDARMPVGAMLGTKEKADAQSGPAENPQEVALSNRYFAEMFGIAPHRYISGTRNRRHGKSYSVDESRATLATAIASTAEMPAVKQCPAGLPCGSQRVADSFLGMKKSSKGESGSMAWEDISTSIVHREIWAETIAALKDDDKNVLDFAMSAQSMAELGVAAGQSRQYADKRGGGKRRLVAANDNLRNALLNAAGRVGIPRSRNLYR